MNRIIPTILLFFVVGPLVMVADYSTRAQAGCNHLYRQQVVHHAAVVQPIVLYGVGSDLAIEAAVERAFQRREQRAPVAPQPGTLQQNASVIAAKCARCHSGNEPAGGIDFRWKIDDFAFRRTVEMLGESINVPEKMAAVIKGLTPEEKGAITSEMMRLPTKPEPVVSPPPPAEAPGVLR